MLNSIFWQEVAEPERCYRLRMSFQSLRFQNWMHFLFVSLGRWEAPQLSPSLLCDVSVWLCNARGNGDRDVLVSLR